MISNLWLLFYLVSDEDENKLKYYAVGKRNVFEAQEEWILAHLVELPN